MSDPYGAAIVRTVEFGFILECPVKDCTRYARFTSATTLDYINSYTEEHYETVHSDISLLHRAIHVGRMTPHDFGEIRREYEYGPVNIPCCSYAEKHPIHHAEEIWNQ